MNLFNIIYIILIIIVCYFLFNNIIKKSVNKKHILAHRGFSITKKEENTLKSIEVAINKNFKGVEIDIFYDKTIDDFVVSHDKYKNPRDLLSLEDMFNINIPKNFIFWLDLKNLSDSNVNKCKKKFIDYMNKFKNIEFFVESTSYHNLLKISFLSNIKTSYWINNWEQLLYPQWFTYTSLSYQNYDKNPVLFDLFSRSPINLFTINNKEKLKSYYSKNRTAFLLTDTSIIEDNL